MIKIRHIDESLVVKSTTKIIGRKDISIIFPGGKEETLHVEAIADLKNIKPEHHEIFIKAFQKQYG
tara:strand:- start:34661 stop:34858 length:198 start_codon:yes stop_codon:yes gene_type:complete